VKRSVQERFAEKVDRSGECWLWTGSLNPKGYGTLYAGAPNASPLKAHRVAWEIANGPVPTGLNVLHRCDIPACVRPDHLFLGTIAENNADAGRKGRMSSRLTPNEVLAIREKRRAGAKVKDLAVEYRVDPTWVSQIVNGHQRRYVVTVDEVA
jgi:hypothetical protein